MKKRFVFFLAILFFGNLLAQPTIDFNNYQPLKCVGNIPEDFQTLTRDRYDLSKRTEAAHNHNKPVSEEEADFLLETDYSINEMLLSGKVLFGDTVTTYINRVADHVLADDPELRGKLRFYCLRSSEANAFSNRQGIVFVTIGLMAQLENEAQLAFVLSHEIAHYEKRHTLVSYEQRQVVFDKNRADRYNSYDEQIRTASNYNKDIELEADSLGLIRLAKSGYDCQESLGSLFMLQFSELPFEDYPFKSDFLETQYMKLPHNLFLDSLRPINFKSDMEDDDYSTHPNVATRRKKLQLILDKLQNCGKEKFKENEKTFLLVRKIARFESVRILLSERQYAEAIYNAQILQVEDPSSYYLKLSIGKALYGMTKYKNHERYAETAGYYGKKEGNQQQCYHLFSVLKPAQINLIALRYLYNLSLSDSSAFIVGMRDDMAEEAVEINEITVDEMKKAFDNYTAAQKELKTNSVANKDSTVKKTDNTPVQPTDPNAFVSKYDKLRNQKQQQDQNELIDSKFHLLAFAELLGDQKFIHMFADAEKKVPSKALMLGVEDDAPDPDIIPYKLISSSSAIKKNIQDGVGTDSVVFVQPFYWITDAKKGFVPLESEVALIAFDSILKLRPKESNLNCSYLFPKDFGTRDVDQYNDFCILTDWLSEKLDHGDLRIFPSQTDCTTTLSQKYHTNYFSYVGITDYEKETDYYLFVYDVTHPDFKFKKDIYYRYSPDKSFISNCILFSTTVIGTK